MSARTGTAVSLGWNASSISITSSGHASVERMVSINKRLDRAQTPSLGRHECSEDDIAEVMEEERQLCQDVLTDIRRMQLASSSGKSPPTPRMKKDTKTIQRGKAIADARGKLRILGRYGRDRDTTRGRCRRTFRARSPRWWSSKSGAKGKGVGSHPSQGPTCSHGPCCDCCYCFCVRRLEGSGQGLELASPSLQLALAQSYFANGALLTKAEQRIPDASSLCFLFLAASLFCGSLSSLPATLEGYEMMATPKKTFAALPSATSITLESICMGLVFFAALPLPSCKSFTLESTTSDTVAAVKAKIEADRTDEHDSMTLDAVSCTTGLVDTLPSRTDALLGSTTDDHMPCMDLDVWLNETLEELDKATSKTDHSVCTSRCVDIVDCSRCVDEGDSPVLTDAEREAGKSACVEDEDLVPPTSTPLNFDPFDPMSPSLQMMLNASKSEHTSDTPSGALLGGAGKRGRSPSGQRKGGAAESSREEQQESIPAAAAKQTGSNEAEESRIGSPRGATNLKLTAAVEIALPMDDEMGEIQGGVRSSRRKLTPLKKKLKNAEIAEPTAESPREVPEEIPVAAARSGGTDETEESRIRSPQGAQTKASAQGGGAEKRKTPLTPAAERMRKSRARMTEEQKEDARDKNATSKRKAWRKGARERVAQRSSARRTPEEVEAENKAKEGARRSMRAKKAVELAQGHDFAKIKMWEVPGRDCKFKHFADNPELSVLLFYANNGSWRDRVSRMLVAWLHVCDKLVCELDDAKDATGVKLAEKKLNGLCTLSRERLEDRASLLQVVHEHIRGDDWSLLEDWKGEQAINGFETAQLEWLVTKGFACGEDCKLLREKRKQRPPLVDSWARSLIGLKLKVPGGWWDNWPAVHNRTPYDCEIVDVDYKVREAEVEEENDERYFVDSLRVR